MKIHSITTERSIDKFEFLAFNRPIGMGAVHALESSIERNGIIRPVTIISTNAITGKRGWYVADGQHLLTALQRRNQDIPWIEISIKNREDIYSIVAELNTTAKTWRVADYVRLWAASGKKEFLELQDLVVETGFNHAQICVAMTGNSRSFSEIKRGDLKFIRKRFGLKIINEVVRLDEVMSVTSDVIMGYYLFRRDMKTAPYDVENMYAKVSHRPDLLAPIHGMSSKIKWKNIFQKIWKSAK